MEKHFPRSSHRTVDPLHPRLIQILPQPERERFQQLCGQKSVLGYPPIKLSGCPQIKTIMSPGTTAFHPQWFEDEGIGAQVCLKRDDETDSSVLHVRAVLVGRLMSNRKGELCLDDTQKSISISVAPSPPPFMRDAFTYIRNWRYIPRRAGSEGYFEVLLRDLIRLTSRGAPNRQMNASPVKCVTPLVSLCARITAKSCRIATRRQSCCFLLELSGKSNSTIIVFRDGAVAWWPFLQVGLEVNIRGLRLCTLPSYGRRTVFLASNSTVEAMDSVSVPPSRVQDCSKPSKRPRVSQSALNVRQIPLHNECTVDYEGLITDVLADGRFTLDHRVTFHPGPIHSFGSTATSSLNFRKGTSIKVFNAHLVQRYDDSRLFPTAKSSIEVLYFGETVHILNESESWRQSAWDRLWKRLDRQDVLWAEELYDGLATKFWHWLRNSTQPECEGTDRDRIACLLGIEDEVGLVQYVMHLLSGREEFVGREAPPSRDIYKEFLEPSTPSRNVAKRRFPYVVTLTRVKEMVLLSQLGKEKKLKELSLNPEEGTSTPSEAIVLHHSQILSRTRKSLSNHSSQKSQQAHPMLSGLLHKLDSENNQLAISDASQTLPVRVVGQLEPALIGAVILVMNYWVVVDFRKEDHELVTAVFGAASVKTIVDGPYAEMGNSVVTGPLVCQTQSCSQPVQNEGNICCGSAGLSQKLVSLTRRTSTPSPNASNLEASARVADVPLVCMFVDAVRCRTDRVELDGRLMALRGSNDEAWEIFLKDEAIGTFWTCRLALSGDAAMDLAPVFQENRLWGVSCTELSGELNPRSFLRNKATRDVQWEILLSSTFDKVVPWIEDLSKGEYMRYMQGQTSAVIRGAENLSEMSPEGKQYSLVRDAVESFSTSASARITTDLWGLYNATNGDKCNVLHIRGEITRNRAWDSLGGSKGNTECLLTIRDEDLGIAQIPIDFHERKHCLTGLAPGMLVLIYNVHRRQEVPWARCKFKAGIDTTVRCLHITNTEAKTGDNASNKDHVLLKRLPWIDLAEFERMPCEKWVGVTLFDILEVLEIRVRRQRSGSYLEEGVNVEIRVSAIVEDGTTKARLHCGGFDNCCKLLGLSATDKRKLVDVARESGTVTVNSDNGDDIGLGDLFSGNWGWHSVTGVIVCEECVTGRDVVMKSFNLGFGSKVWTACREDVSVVDCIAVLSSGAAALRARVCAM